MVDVPVDMTLCGAEFNSVCLPFGIHYFGIHYYRALRNLRSYAGSKRASQKRGASQNPCSTSNRVFGRQFYKPTRLCALTPTCPRPSRRGKNSEQTLTPPSHSHRHEISANSGLDWLTRLVPICRAAVLPGPGHPGIFQCLRKSGSYVLNLWRRARCRRATAPTAEAIVPNDVPFSSRISKY